MFDRWKLQDFAPGQGLALGAQAAHVADDAWLPIAVPGDVHRALIAAGRIPDPFYDRNEDSVRLDGGARVVVPAAFDGPTAPPDGGRAPAAGLPWPGHLRHDLAERRRSWASHRNMFRQAVFDVTGAAARRPTQYPGAVLRSAARRRCDEADAAAVGTGGSRRRAPRCAKPSLAMAGTGARACRRSASGGRSSCAGSGAPRWRRAVRHPGDRSCHGRRAGSRCASRSIASPPTPLTRTIALTCAPRMAREPLRSR